MSVKIRKSQPQEKPLLSARGLMRYLGLSAKSVDLLLTSGEIPCIRVGNRRYVTRKAIEKWLEKGTGTIIKE